MSFLLRLQDNDLSAVFAKVLKLQGHRAEPLTEALTGRDTGPLARPLEPLKSDVLADDSQLGGLQHVQQTGEGLVECRGAIA
ncbi:hypothetical protein D9M68_926310 [compost metagenome]